MHTFPSPHVAEGLITVVGIVLVLGEDAAKLMKEYNDGIASILQEVDPDNVSEEQKKAIKDAAADLLQRIRDSIPEWKIVIIVLFMACM